MQIVNIMIMFLAMLLLAALLRPLADYLRIPHALILVLTGFVGSEVITSLGYDTGLRWHHFQELVFYVFLPVLVFEAALQINARQLLKRLLPIILLSTPLLLLATAASAVLLYYGIGYPLHYPFLAALLTGVLLSATDPGPVIPILRKAKVSEDFILLIEGESLFNDASAILLFTLISSLLFMPNDHFSVVYAAKSFSFILIGGIAAGCLILLLLGACFYWVKDSFSRMVIMLAAAYAGYVVAESVLQVSGVICVLVAGLGFGEILRRDPDNTHNFRLADHWRVAGELSSAMIFLLLGVTVTVAMFEQQWLAMLIGIASVLIARGIGLLMVVPFINILPGTQLSCRDGFILYWGGSRGAVTIALALSLPLELDAWFTIQSIAYGVVLFSLCVQVTSLQWLHRDNKEGN